MAHRDKIWLGVFLANILYVAVLAVSRCQWVDGPFAFVRGCHNYGVDWNSFMAPLGFVFILALPLSLAYWLRRGIQVLFHVKE